jgi:hypothetical protein
MLKVRARYPESKDNKRRLFLAYDHHIGVPHTALGVKKGELDKKQQLITIC